MLHGTGIFTYIWLELMVNVGKYSSPMGHFGYVTIATFVRLNPYKDNKYQDEGGREKLTKTKSWKANRILKKHWVEKGLTHPFLGGKL